MLATAARSRTSIPIADVVGDSVRIPKRVSLARRPELTAAVVGGAAGDVVDTTLAGLVVSGDVVAVRRARSAASRAAEPSGAASGSVVATVVVAVVSLAGGAVVGAPPRSAASRAADPSGALRPDEAFVSACLSARPATPKPTAEAARSAPRTTRAALGRLKVVETD
jgi:hypothetical protein